MKLPKSVYNWTSVIGLTVAIIALFMIGFLLTISIFFNQGGSYLGIFIYMVLPFFLVLGLIFIPIGMGMKVRRDKKSGESSMLRWPKLDFNEPRNRNGLMVFCIGSTIFLLLSAVGSYEAFHITESNKFCGTLCHEAMEPEYVAYQNSAHARVKCVECHVGEGADWYVRSKISGLRQVIAVATNSIPRHIPTPIENLRPARETCEECHWPEKFYARQNRLEKHYLADETNTEWDISMQMKTGPNYSALGLQEGIHWHINSAVTIEYKSDSKERLVIPWVKYTNTETGEVVIYQDTEDPLSEEQINSIESRTMDCMDCHNRPSHNYLSPSKFVDNAMTAGKLPKDVPELKLMAMGILHEEYPTKDSAMNAIAQGVSDFYENDYAEIYNADPAKFDQIALVLQEEFAKNIFPAMKTSWKVYPDHSSHLETPGCNRCHDDKHVSKQQNVIPRDCNLCHVINAQGTPGNMETTEVFKALEFKHPVDIDGEWKTMLCSDCHSAMF